MITLKEENPIADYTYIHFLALFAIECLPKCNTVKLSSWLPIK